MRGALKSIKAAELESWRQQALTPPAFKASPSPSVSMTHSTCSPRSTSKVHTPRVFPTTVWPISKGLASHIPACWLAYKDLPHLYHH